MQEDVILHTLGGGDSVVLMPTGGGKSLCYQIPSLMKEGCGIVVSPLIALMNDQVQALVANGIPAAAIHSCQDEASNRQIADRLFAGQVKLLYISPERLQQEVARWSTDIKVSLIAIDEAHCISRWGHDFRPAYTQLAMLKSHFPRVPIMALTATADALTRDDIAQQLRLSSPRFFITSFDRPNLSLKVCSSLSSKERLKQIAAMIERHPHDAGIVYAMTRREVETIYRSLTALGYRAALYHAGMAPAARDEMQRLWVSGEKQVMCATVAFGMGIDKSNIRWVIHNNLPSNIESYYQEIGRAGRDGLPAETILNYNFADLVTLRHFADESGMPELNHEKLQRMIDFAEAKICRRRMLLSYFGEVMDHDCGNCDVCSNPPERFDGLMLIKMALSAIIRMGEKEGHKMVIDVLRGMSGAQLTARGYHLIKTYGAGREVAFGDWKDYLTQMLQMGLVEVAYNEGNALKVTPYGRQVLFSSEPFLLARPRRQHLMRGAKRVAVEPVASSPSERLLAALKALRSKVAKKEHLADYMVFSDRTLQQMVERWPVAIKELYGVEGMSNHKLVRYGFAFLQELRAQRGLPKDSDDASATSRVLAFVGLGITPLEIAGHQGVKSTTIYGHLTRAITDGLFDDFKLVITRQQYLRCMQLRQLFPGPEYYIEAEKEMPGGLPRMALAIAERLTRK